MSEQAAISGPQPDVATQSLARPAAVMAVGTALSRITGLGRTIALVGALGVTESRLADSYNLANTVPFVVYELVLGGVLSSVFVPVMVEQLRTRDHASAWGAVSALVGTASLALVTVSALTALTAPWIIDLLTLRVPAAAAADQQELASFFLMLFAPQIALLGFSAIAAALLHAHGRFGPPMFLPILNNLVVIGALLAFAVLVSGVATNRSVADSTFQKLLLTLGTTAGFVAMFLGYLPFLRRLPGRLRPRVDFRHPLVRRSVRLAGWTLFYVGFNTVGWAVSAALANQVQGGPTAYYTAFAFFQLPIGIAAVSVMTALLPKLSAHHVDGDMPAFRARLADGIRMNALLMLPATAGFVVLAQPLAEVLLEHGVAGQQSTELLADVLAMFSLGLLPFAAFLLLIRAFYSLQDTRTPALINLVGTGSTIGLDFVLIGPLGVPGLALAHSLGFLIGSAVAALVLRRRVGELGLRRTLRETAKVLTAAGLAATVMAGVSATLAGELEAGTLRSLAQLVAAGGLGAAGFLLVARALRVENLSFFARLLPGR